MQRDHRHRFSIEVGLVEVGAQRNGLQEQLEIRGLLIGVLHIVSLERLRRRKQFAHVLESVRAVLLLRQRRGQAEGRDARLERFPGAAGGERGPNVCESFGEPPQAARRHPRDAVLVPRPRRDEREGLDGLARVAARAGELLQPLQTFRPDPAPRPAHGAHESDVIRRIHEKAQIGDDILHLATFVERDASHDPVRNAGSPERLLERPRLGVGPIEHRKLVQAPGAAAGLDLRRHPRRFGPLVVAADDLDRIAGLPLRVQPLRFPREVPRDHGVRDLEDRRRRAIVALHPHDVRAVEIGLEVEDVPDVRSAPSVHRLIVIPHDAQVPVFRGQRLHHPVLGVVRVLVFVHEHVGEAGSVAIPHAVHGLEQAHRLEEEVVEVVGVAPREFTLVRGIDLRHDLRQQVEGLGLVFGGPHERVLRAGDPAAQGSGRPTLRIVAHRLHHVLQRADGVILVIDREGARAGRVRGFNAKDARGDRVEGADPQAPRGTADESLDPFPHLAGGLVREGDGEEARRLQPLFDEAGGPGREYPRLAGARAREDEQRPFAVFNRVPLLRVEAESPHVPRFPGR